MQTTSNVVNASTDLTGLLTAREVLEKSKLNWTVEKQNLFLKNGNIVADKFAVVRNDNNQSIGIVGNVYEPFQNIELTTTLETLVSEKLASFKRGWGWDGGSKVGIVADIPKRLYVLGKDELAVQITGWNSFDGTSPVHYSVDVLRLVCSNGLKRFVKKGYIRAKHCGTTQEKLLAAREVLGLAINSLSDILNQAEQLARKKANAEMVESFLKGINLNKIEDESTQRENQRMKLLSLFDNGIGLQDSTFKHSLWALYNAATEMVDHKNGNANYERKAVSAVYGSGAKFKEDALNSVLELVG